VRCACSCDLPPLLVAFDRFVGVLGVRLGVSGGCRVAGLGFDELRAGSSSSYVAALLFVVGADHSARCFVIARALCLLQRPPSTPHRVRSVRGCLGCSSWSDVASDLVRRFSAGASGLPRVPTESGGWPGHFRRLLCFKSPFVGRRSIARVPGGNAGREFSGCPYHRNKPRNKPHEN
jgi:hypothetical protein